MMADHQDYPPVALGRLDDRSRWHWLGADRPDGWLDWTFTAFIVAIACVPMLLVYCPICWAIRAITRKAGA